ncbi:MAG: ferritin [Treponema sp.]|nr:ferritin [Treponema sp.]
MISEKLTKALNDQINAEYYSAYMYLSMSAYAEGAALKGSANWLYVQAQEEMTHGLHMYQYLMDRGGRPTFAPITQPPHSFTSIDDVFNQVLAHEQKVTGGINAIATLAMQENDHAAYQFIMWYVNEQVEEEANATDIIGKLNMINGDKRALLALDNELATRVFVNPFPANAP